MTGSDWLNALVKRALEHDAEATQALLRAVAPSVRRTCRGVLGAQHSDLEDAVQESLIGVLQALGAYRFEAKFSHYVTKIALRVAIGAKRKTALQQLFRDPLDERVEGHADLDPMVNGEQSLERAEWLRLLIHRLPAPQAETLLLRFVLGYSLEETAAITEVSPNTAKTRIRLAKNALRGRLTPPSRIRPPLERRSR